MRALQKPLRESVGVLARAKLVEKAALVQAHQLEQKHERWHAIARAVANARNGREEALHHALRVAFAQIEHGRNKEIGAKQAAAARREELVIRNGRRDLIGERGDFERLW